MRLSEDDPLCRRPDIALTKSFPDWEPKVKLADGLERTIDFFRKLRIAMGQDLVKGEA